MAKVEYINNPRYPSERILLERLKTLPARYRVFTSFYLWREETGRYAEIDFAVVTPAGVYLIDAKHSARVDLRGEPHSWKLGGRKEPSPLRKLDEHAKVLAQRLERALGRGRRPRVEARVVFTNPDVSVTGETRGAYRLRECIQELAEANRRAVEPHALAQVVGALRKEIGRPEGPMLGEDYDIVEDCHPGARDRMYRVEGFGSRLRHLCCLYQAGEDPRVLDSAIETIERTYQELSRDPLSSIPSVSDIKAQRDGELYLVLYPDAEGFRPLSHWIGKEREQLAEDEVSTIVEQSLEALAHLHRMDLTHGRLSARTLFFGPAVQRVFVYGVTGSADVRTDLASLGAVFESLAETRDDEVGERLRECAGRLKGDEPTSAEEALEAWRSMRTVAPVEARGVPADPRGLSKGAEIDGRYRVEARIGGSAEDDVRYVVRDGPAKLLLKFYLGGAEARERCERELRALQRIGSHPNIAQVRGSNPDHDPPYLLFDYAAGWSLGDVCEVGTASEIERIARESARALAHMHGRFVYHRRIDTDTLVETDGGTILHSLEGAEVASRARPELAAEDVHALGRALLKALGGRLPPEDEAPRLREVLQGIVEAEEPRFPKADDLVALLERRPTWRDAYPRRWRDVGEFFAERLYAGIEPFEGYCNVVALPDSGGWGRVYLCNAGEDGPWRAVKIVRVSDRGDPEASERESLEQWRREMEQAKLLAHVHADGVAALARAVETECPGFLEFEGISGCTLRDRLEAPDPLPLGLCTRWVREIANALHIVWREGLEWTDLRPENVMIRDDRKVVLVDPGPCLPPRYTPPEWTGPSPSFSMRGNVYSLAVMFLEMLAMDRGDRQKAFSVIEGSSICEFPEVGDERRGLRDGIFEICRRRLRDDPDRWHRADEIASRLTRVLDHALDAEPRYRITTPRDLASQVCAILAVEGGAEPIDQSP